ncbi:MAG TPA: hypothetical protein VF526_15210 [Solirubrobacteraceae bacterium]|jgi:hypothetical protein
MNALLLSGWTLDNSSWVLLCGLFAAVQLNVVYRAGGLQQGDQASTKR